MTDKEFKRLTRSQLIDVIYQLQLQIDNLTEQNQSLQNALVDKHLRINNAGNLAEAALEINNCFRSAQNAAEHYINEIKALREATEVEQLKLRAQAEAELCQAKIEADRIITEAQMEATRLTLDAQDKLAAIMDDTPRFKRDYDEAIEMILQEFSQD